MGYNIHIQLVKLSINHFHKTLIIPKKKSHFFLQNFDHFGEVWHQELYIPVFQAFQSKIVANRSRNLYFVLYTNFRKKFAFLFQIFAFLRANEMRKKAKKFREKFFSFAKRFFLLAANPRLSAKTDITTKYIYMFIYPSVFMHLLCINWKRNERKNKEFSFSYRVVFT